MLRQILGSLIAASLLVAQLHAGLVYDNGPLDGTNSGLLLSVDSQISNSFVVTNATTLTRAEVGLWLGTDDSPVGLDWAIGTAPLLSDIASGTAALVSTFQFENGPIEIYESSFALSVPLLAGTYWLTLSNSTTALGNRALWDLNNGPSTAWNTEGELTNVFQPGSNSESFRLFDATAVVPEPTTVTLVGCGILCIVIRKTRRRVR